jgi:hypothetical protein
VSVDNGHLIEVVTEIRRRGGDLGKAATLLRLSATAHSGVVTQGWLHARGVDLHHDGAARRSVEALEATGVFGRAPTSSGWKLPSTRQLEELASALQGAAVAWNLADRALAPEIAVTMPPSPSDIGRALECVLMDYTRLMNTDDALDAVAARAVGEFTVLTPFLNDAAAPTLARVFTQAAAPKRTLVIRNFAKVRKSLMIVREELESANVLILDYRVPVRAYQNRTAVPAYETFHAKVALADHDHAYVGSANFLRYARSSVELGVLMNGRSVRVVSELVAAIKRVALPCQLRRTAS